MMATVLVPGEIVALSEGFFEDYQLYCNQRTGSGEHWFYGKDGAQEPISAMYLNKRPMTKPLIRRNTLADAEEVAFLTDDAKSFLWNQWLNHSHVRNVCTVGLTSTQMEPMPSITHMMASVVPYVCRRSFGSIP